MGGNAAFENLCLFLHLALFERKRGFYLCLIFDDLVSEAYLHWILHRGQQEDNTERLFLFDKTKCLHDKRWLDCKAGLLENRRPFKYLSKGSGKTNRRCEATRGLFIAYSVSSPCIFTLTFTFTFIFTMVSHPRRRMGREGTGWAAVNYLMLTGLPIVNFFFFFCCDDNKNGQDFYYSLVLCKSLCL